MSSKGEKATFYIATPFGGAGVIPPKLVIGLCVRHVGVYRGCGCLFLQGRRVKD